MWLVLGLIIFYGYLTSEFGWHLFELPLIPCQLLRDCGFNLQDCTRRSKNIFWLKGALQQFLNVVKKHCRLLIKAPANVRAKDCIACSTEFLTLCQRCPMSACSLFSRLRSRHKKAGASSIGWFREGHGSGWPPTVLCRYCGCPLCSAMCLFLTPLKRKYRPVWSNKNEVRMGKRRTMMLSYVTFGTHFTPYSFQHTCADNRRKLAIGAVTILDRFQTYFAAGDLWGNRDKYSRILLSHSSRLHFSACLGIASMGSSVHEGITKRDRCLGANALISYSGIRFMDFWHQKCSKNSVLIGHE